MILAVSEAQHLGSWIPQPLCVYYQAVLIEENKKLTALPSSLTYPKIFSHKIG